MIFLSNLLLLLYIKLQPVFFNFYIYTNFDFTIVLEYIFSTYIKLCENYFYIMSVTQIFTKIKLYFLNIKSSLMIIISFIINLYKIKT
jgi:hypothetical protein